MPETITLAAEAAERQAVQWIDEWTAGLAAELAPLEPKHTLEIAFDALRAAEELINLPIVLMDQGLVEQIMAIPLDDPVLLVRVALGISPGMELRFDKSVAARFKSTLYQLSALRSVFLAKGYPAGRELSDVAGAWRHLQSRRRILLALLHTIPRACRGSRRLQEAEGLARLLELVESPGMGIINMHRNVMLAKVYPDFRLLVIPGRRGALASHEFPSLNSMFLDAERAAITEMPTDGIDRSKLAPVDDHHIFSAAELSNDLKLIAGAFSEFNLMDTSFGALASFIEMLLPSVMDNYYLKLPKARFESVCDQAGLPSAVRSALVVDSDDFVKNSCTHAPFTVISDQLITTVALLSRFANHWKNVCLNRVRRYQIRTGFIFENSLKDALEPQGFEIKDIKRIDRAEFDVIAVLAGVIYNLQCKNNFVDIDRIEIDVKKFVRYNRYLQGAYDKALAKEVAREHLLMAKLGLSKIKHFVISRFPVATSNPRIISFGQIHRFRGLAEPI